MNGDSQDALHPQLTQQLRETTGDDGKIDYAALLSRIDQYYAEKEHTIQRLSQDLDQHRLHLEELVSKRAGELLEAKTKAEAAHAEISAQIKEKERMEKQLNAYVERMEIMHYNMMEARDKAVEADKAKSDFLANMSHEIRTPMNGVLGMTRLLLDTSLGDEQRGWTEIIRKSGEGLLEIINDILDFSKIEAGRLVLEPLNFDLQTTIAEATDILMFKSQEKVIELAVEIAADIPRFVIGDPGRFKQILLNLAGNAIKFTDKGHVLIRVRSETVGTEQVRIHVAVEDTGIGLAPDKAARIFEKFTQAEESTTRKYGGTGLGLAISKRLANLMQGDIRVTSELGRGSVFSFDVVLGIGKQEAIRTMPTDNLRDLRILIVDDYLLNREIFYQYTQRWGMRCEVVATLEAAADALQRARGEDDPYRFVILDYWMQGEDSFAFVKEQKAGLGRDIFFCLVTATGQTFLPEELMSAGFSALLYKPIYPDHMEAMLRILWHAHQKGEKSDFVNRYLISKLHSEDASKPATPDKYFDGVRVLAVDDIQVNLMLLTKVLQKLGCSVDIAGNGKEAVEMIQQFEYDMVFMDCQMPEMDGFEATKYVRAEEQSSGKHTTIIALTADAMVGDREKCLKVGMDDYLNKPFKPEQIASLLQKWLSVQKGLSPAIKAG